MLMYGSEGPEYLNGQLSIATDVLFGFQPVQTIPGWSQLVIQKQDFEFYSLLDRFPVQSMLFKYLSYTLKYEKMVNWPLMCNTIA